MSAPTEARREHEVVLIGLSTGRFAVLAQDVVCFEHPDKRREQGATPMSIDELLGATHEAGGSWKSLVVNTADGSLALRTRGHLRLARVRSDSFLWLPKVLRAACAPWVCGVAVLEDAPVNLAVWINLIELALHLLRRKEP